MKRALKFAVFAGAGFFLMVSGSVFAATAPYHEPNSNEVYDSYEAYLAHEKHETMSVPASVPVPAPTAMSLATGNFNAVSNMQLLNGFVGGTVFNQLLTSLGAGVANTAGAPANLANVSGVTGTVKLALNLINVIVATGAVSAATAPVNANGAVATARVITAPANTVAGNVATVPAVNAAVSGQGANNTVVTENAANSNSVAKANDSATANEVATAKDDSVAINASAGHEEQQSQQSALNAKGAVDEGSGTHNAMNAAVGSEMVFGYSSVDAITNGIHGSDAARSDVPSNG